MPLWRTYVGDPAVAEDRERIVARSPLHRAADLQRSLLFIQGERDARVPREQADRMAAALRAAGKDVDYVLVSSMGHVPLRWPGEYEDLPQGRGFPRALPRCPQQRLRFLRDRRLGIQGLA